MSRPTVTRYVVDTHRDSPVVVELQCIEHPNSITVVFPDRPLALGCRKRVGKGEVYMSRLTAASYSLAHRQNDVRHRRNALELAEKELARVRNLYDDVVREEMKR